MEIYESTDIDLKSSFPDRPFECSCKKSYKSYPALYTHIKNKHNGIVTFFLLSHPEKLKNRPYPPKNLEDLPIISRNNPSTSTLSSRILLSPTIAFNLQSQKNNQP